MKAKAVEIRWHGTKAIYSADFQRSVPSNLATLVPKKASHPYAQTDEEKRREALAEEEGRVWRLATAGGDNMVMTWLVHPNPALTRVQPTTGGGPAPPTLATTTGTGSSAPAVEYLATLAKHQGVVNVVRFCPQGEVLASGGDDGNVLLWVLASGTGAGAVAFGETAEDRAYERECWRTRLLLRGPAQCEIYDLAWSPCGDFLLTGDTAKTAKIWNATDGQCIKQITEHTNFVQGVAWDPLGQYIATQSSDRSMHIYMIHITKEENGAASAEVQPVGRHAKMDVLQTPGGSTWASSPSVSPAPASASASIHASAVPTPALQPIRPLPKRSVSVASDLSLRSTESSNLVHLPTPSGIPSASSSMQPPAEIPHHHQNQRSHSRQSSVSTHASPALSATPGHRMARSPSPAPPLPAVNVELERNSHRSFLDADWGRRERGTVKLYGDEGVSAFFRRLEFSPDGGLLVSPAGRWEDPWDVGVGLGNGAEGKGKGKGKGKEDEALANVVGDLASGKKKRKIRPTQLSSAGGGEKPTVYLYGRAAFAAGKPPLAHLPGHRTSSVAIRFSPVVYELREGVRGKDGVVGPVQKRRTKVVDLEKGKMVEVSLESGVKKEEEGTGKIDVDPEAEGDEDGEEMEAASVFALPYRMMYAVATHDTVMVYDTQQAGPVCMFGNLHYASFTDVAWSEDGDTLVLSSSDGYCSLVVFDKNELGKPTKLPPARSLPTPAPTPLATPVPHAAHPHPHPGGSQPTLAAYLAPVPASGGSSSAAGSVELGGVKVEEVVVQREKQRARNGDGEEEGEPRRKKKRAALVFEGPVNM